MIDKRVGITSRRGHTYSSGIGRIMVPPQVDRDSFVKNCLLTGYVSIQPEFNNAIHRVKCDKGILQTLEFPTDTTELGSQVVYINLPKSKLPVVIANISSITEYNQISENQFDFSRSTEFGAVSIVGDGKGRLSISVSADKPKSGAIDVNLTSVDDSAKFTINVAGSVSLSASKQVDIKSPLINHNSGAEPMVLGDTLLAKLSSLLDLLANETVVTSIGLQPLVNAAQYSALKDELEEFLSTKSKLS